MRQCIHAYTEMTPPLDVYYPAYVSLNRGVEGTAWLSVRTRGESTSSRIELTHEQLKQLADDILSNLNDKE